MGGEETGGSIEGTITLKAVFPDQKTAGHAYRSLKAEEAGSGRFSSKLELEDNVLKIRIEGRDMVALRASVNSYLRYLSMMENIEVKKNED